MSTYQKKRKVYKVTYEAVDPLLPEMQKKVDLAFDILFDAVLKEGSLLHDGCRRAGVKCFDELMGTEQFANPITLIATYARVSTARQEEERTIEVQLGALRDFARERGYTIVKEYVDDGWSGDILAEALARSVARRCEEEDVAGSTDLRPRSIGSPLLVPGARDGRAARHGA